MDTRQREKVSDALRSAREALGLSRYDAAQQAGVSEARWRQLENGVVYRNGTAKPANTTADTLARMAAAVQINPAELLEAAGFPATAAEVVTSTPTPPVVNTIHLDDFTSRDADMIRAFVAGLEAGKKKK